MPVSSQNVGQNFVVRHDNIFLTSQNSNPNNASLFRIGKGAKSKRNERDRKFLEDPHNGILHESHSKKMTT